MRLIGLNGGVIEVGDAHGEMLLSQGKWKKAPIEKPKEVKRKVGRPRKSQGDK
jgi:hypothetical protein